MLLFVKRWRACPYLCLISSSWQAAELWREKVNKLIVLPTHVLYGLTTSGTGEESPTTQTKATFACMFKYCLICRSCQLIRYRLVCLFTTSTSAGQDACPWVYDG